MLLKSALNCLGDFNENLIALVQKKIKIKNVYPIPLFSVFNPLSQLGFVAAMFL